MSRSITKTQLQTRSKPLLKERLASLVLCYFDLQNRTIKHTTIEDEIVSTIDEMKRRGMDDYLAVERVLFHGN